MDSTQRQRGSCLSCTTHEIKFMPWPIEGSTLRCSTCRCRTGHLKSGSASSSSAAEAQLHQTSSVEHSSLRTDLVLNTTVYIAGISAYQEMWCCW